MSLTKDEVSDLKSNMDLVERRVKELQTAEWVLTDARKLLETFIYYQQYPEQKK